MARSFVSDILRRSKVRRAWRHLATGTTSCLAHEELGALDGRRGNAGPDRRPTKMRNRRHRLRVYSFIRFRKDLFGGASRPQLKSCAASAAHAERLPFETAIERVVIFGQSHQHLIRRGSIARPAGQGDDSVRFRSIGDHRSAAHERNAGSRFVQRRAALERTLPPPCPSVVEEARSNCSAATRLISPSCQGLPVP